MTIYIPGKLILNNGLRPQAIAGVAPTLDYRFARDKREIEAVSLTDKLTFTGGNQGTFVGSDGYIQRATTNVPRFDHDPVSLVSEGLLVEGSSGNLIYPSSFTSFGTVAANNIWYKTLAEIDVAANYAASPDGLKSAALLSINSATSNRAVTYRTNTGTQGTYTFSLFCKAESTDTRTRLILGGETTLADFCRADYSLSGTGSVVASLAFGTAVFQGQPTISVVSDGWYRCTLTAQLTSPSNITVLVLPGDAFSQSTASRTLVWGAQLETGTPSTYIPTTTVAVTRTADSAVIDGTGVLTGTYTMVAKPEGSAVVSGSNIVLQEGYTTERVMVFPAALSAAQITAIRSAM
jgi:hypothetical protein